MGSAPAKLETASVSTGSYQSSGGWRTGTSSEQRMFRALAENILEGRPVALQQVQCDLSPYLRDVKVKSAREKASASPSLIVFAKVLLGNLDQEVCRLVTVDRRECISKVSIKMWPTPVVRDPYTAFLWGLEYERNVYLDVVPEMLRDSPHFVLPIMRARCNLSKVRELYGPAVGRRFDQNMNRLQQLYGARVSADQVSIVMTEQACRERQRACSLEDTFEALEQADNREDMVHLWFQYMYTLLVLQKYHMCHNDNHNKNVLVYEYEEPQTTYYNVDSVTFRVTSRYSLMMFDWDNAYAEQLGANPKLELDTRFHGDNRYQPLRDMFWAVLVNVADHNDQVMVDSFFWQAVGKYQFSAESLNRAFRDMRPQPVDHMRNDDSEAVWRAAIGAETLTEFVQHSFPTLQYSFEENPLPDDKSTPYYVLL